MTAARIEKIPGKWAENREALLHSRLFQQPASERLNQAMVSLADSDEMRPLLCEASSEGKALAIDIFQNRDGQPIFINFKKENL